MPDRGSQPGVNIVKTLLGISSQALRILLLLNAVLVFGAELSSADRGAIKEMTHGVLYLRNNVPCRMRSGGFGIGAEVLTEVSPGGVDWDKNLKAIETETKGKKRRGVDTIYWGFGPNDAIQYGKLYFKDNGVVELYAEGLKPKNEEVWIRFVNIHSRDDFKKAYDLIVGVKPIEDDHPDWPDSIRQAIKERKIVEGMTKAQAFAVVGTPTGAETSQDGDKKIETWFPRQDTGSAGSFRKVVSSQTGFPASIRFVDGKVAAIGPIGQSVRVDINK
jgi:hypothetical protein